VRSWQALRGLLLVAVAAGCGARSGPVGVSAPGPGESEPGAGPGPGAGPNEGAPHPPDAGPTPGDGLDLPPAPGYLKGQLHLHTVMSGDSDEPAEDVVAFYQSHGYDFIVITDHNHVTVMANCGEMLVLPGVELTFNDPKCEPPPEKKKCLVHVNALFVQKTPGEISLLKPESHARMDLYQEFLDKSAELGGVAMINHPNFQWTVTPNMAIELWHRGASLIEVANMGMPISNPGDELHPSTEMLWDIVLSSGANMWGVASDDAHDYDSAEVHEAAGKDAVYPGNLGWIMVRAERAPEAIRAAVARGEFYATNGPLLAEWTVDDRALTVVAAGPGGFRVEFVGLGGEVLEVVPGRRGRFELERARGGYVRARVVDAAGRTAWTQPVRVP
jgi:hypothetical protein